ncbi:MAG TPA: hypothetical protein VMG08_12550 [Allosphingosinicella sp.]|nr:hypothetical protein [Allosphingosinicella sp.]
MILALASAALGPAPPAIIDSTSHETCRVLEATYTAAIESWRLAAPVDVRRSDRRLELDRFDAGYIGRLPLTPSEFDALRTRQDRSGPIGFRPRCAWDGFPTPAVHEGHRLWVTFTEPIFSADGDLALVEASFHLRGFGYGRMCVVRRTASGWAARCLPSWVT